MDQLSPLVNEQYRGKGSENYPVVVNEKYAHLMELFKNKLGDEKIRELVKTDIWNLDETYQYAKLFNIINNTLYYEICNTYFIACIGFNMVNILFRLGILI